MSDRNPVIREAGREGGSRLVRPRRALTTAAVGVAAAALLAAVACASLPRPRVFSEVDAVRTSPAAAMAKDLAPQMYLAAEQLRERARAAYDDGDLPAAQVLGEHAMATYEHAFILGRLARAEQRLARAELEVGRAERELAGLDDEQRRVAAEADALELRVQVARDLEPLPTSGPADPQRDRARRDAARSLLLQGRLSCTAARLLAPSTEGLAALLGEISSLEERLAKSAGPAPIDESLRARSSCLGLLTRVRRAAPGSTPDPNRADALLAHLSERGGGFVYRDDRGVVVELRDLFTAESELTTAAAAQLAALGQVAREHATFPVLVVIHGDASGARAAPARGERVAEALRRAGAPQVEVALAGDLLPLVDPARAGAAARNSRVEIVFITPGQ